MTVTIVDAARPVAGGADTHSDLNVASRLVTEKPSWGKYRVQVRRKGITPVIARRGTGHGSGLGTCRWVVEQSLALLHWFRRLRVRWEIRDDIHEAFLSLACAIICWRWLRNLSLCEEF
jgi:hypothetical protein